MKFNKHINKTSSFNYKCNTFKKEMIYSIKIFKNHKISNIRETFSFVPISRECYRCADEHKLRMEREREEIESIQEDLPAGRWKDQGHHTHGTVVI
jgi:hypothetical protein